MIEKTEVKCYKVRLFCTECLGDGEISYMVPTGQRLLSAPPQYPHVCPVCDYKENHTNEYPKIVYEEEE